MLATVWGDGGPRVHPMCPILHERGLFAFIIPSPKQRDLRRDGRFALHSFPPADDEDALVLTGRAVAVGSGPLRAAVAGRFVAERAHIPTAAVGDEDRLFELLIESVLLTRTTGHGDWNPRHTVWRP
jgi:hypothetical protein